MDVYSTLYTLPPDVVNACIPLNSTFALMVYCNTILLQGVLEEFDDIFVAAGTAGTACGLGVANYLTGSKLK